MTFAIASRDIHAIGIRSSQRHGEAIHRRLLIAQRQQRVAGVEQKLPNCRHPFCSAACT